MKSVTKKFVTVLAIACTGSTLSAGLTMIASPSDAQVRTNGNIDSAQLTNWTIRVGEQNAPGAACMVIPFQLPTLDPGAKFVTASLTDQLAGISGAPTFNADLYALTRTSADATVVSADFYAGPSDSAATLIQDNILTPTTPVRGTVAWPYLSFSTSTSGSAALVDFLNAIYAGGANAGKYFFLRFSPDLASMPTGNNAYNITASNAGNSFEKPTITFTTDAVPEPASIATLAGAALMLLSRRKSR